MSAHRGFSMLPAGLTAREPVADTTSRLMWKLCGSDKLQQSAAAKRDLSLGEPSGRQTAADRSSCSRLTSRRSPVRAGHRPFSRARVRSGAAGITPDGPTPAGRCCGSALEAVAAAAGELDRRADARPLASHVPGATEGTFRVVHATKRLSRCGEEKRHVKGVPFACRPDQRKAISLAESFALPRSGLKLLRLILVG